MIPKSPSLMATLVATGFYASHTKMGPDASPNVVSLVIYCLVGKCLESAEIVSFVQMI